jgi:hypothetical protein
VAKLAIDLGCRRRLRENLFAKLALGWCGLDGHLISLAQDL